jgi:hypothetical protein
MKPQPNTKRAPPRSAPPISTEEMTIIKKKVSAPKGPPPSKLEAFRPKSMGTSSTSPRNSDLRGGGGGGISQGSMDDDWSRPAPSKHGTSSSSSRQGYDDYDDEGDSKSQDYRYATAGFAGNQEGSRDRRDSRDRHGHDDESRDRHDYDDSRDRHDYDDSRDRYGHDDSRDRYGHDDSRDRGDRGLQKDHKSDEKRFELNIFDQGKAHGAKESKSDHSHDSEAPRFAKNGRDRIYNFRTKVLHANYKELRTFVKTPCEAGVVVRCYIERSRSLGKNYFSPCYSLCADMEDGSGKELITCRKIIKSKTSHYIFSMRQTDLYRKREERSRVYLGKLRSVSSSEYVMFDSGSNPRNDMIRPDNIRTYEEEEGDEEGEEGEQVNSAAEDAIFKSQLCSIFYHSKTRPTTGLGMEVCVPTVASRTHPVQGDLRTDLVKCFETIRHTGQQNELFAHKCFIMQEKKSKYDPLSSCLVDFQARANTASVKNFQLVQSPPFRLGERRQSDRASDDEIIFQLGKVGDVMWWGGVLCVSLRMMCVLCVVLCCGWCGNKSQLID